MALFVLRNFWDEQGKHDGDVLIELSQLAFSSASTLTVPTQFQVGQVIAVFVTMASDTPTSAVTFGALGTVTAGTPNTITVTASASNSLLVNVMVVARPSV